MHKEMSLQDFINMDKEASLATDNSSKEANMETFNQSNGQTQVNMGGAGSIHDLIKQAENVLPREVRDNAQLLAQLQAENVMKTASIYERAAVGQEFSSKSASMAQEFVTGVYENTFINSLQKVASHWEQCMAAQYGQKSANNVTDALAHLAGNVGKMVPSEAVKDMFKKFNDPETVNAIKSHRMMRPITDLWRNPAGFAAAGADVIAEHAPGLAAAGMVAIPAAGLAAAYNSGKQYEKNRARGF